MSSALRRVLAGGLTSSLVGRKNSLTVADLQTMVRTLDLRRLESFNQFWGFGELLGRLESGQAEELSSTNAEIFFMVAGLLGPSASSLKTLKLM